MYFTIVQIKIDYYVDKNIINSYSIKENRNKKQFNVECYSSNFNNNEKKMYSNIKFIFYIT